MRPTRLSAFRRFVGAFCFGFVCLTIAAFAQRTPIGAMSGQGTLPLINVGGNDMEANFARLDFAQLMLDGQQKQDKYNKEQQQLVTEGVVSALDLKAPSRAIAEFNQAADLMRNQNAQEAAKHLEKALSIYPDFVSAHNNLGLAYLSMDDHDRANAEFETAARLDAKFPGSFLNLGKMALQRQDYTTAQGDLEKAAALLPRDVKVLTVLAYAQNGAHEYLRAIDTAVRIHGMEHKQLANAHYVAAAAAISLNDYATAQRELAFFVQEDPTNALTPVARHNLDVLQHPPAAATVASLGTPHASASGQPETFPNSAKLKAELTALGDERSDETCTNCETPATGAIVNDAPFPSTGGFTLRKTVDEVAVFFSAYSHGHSIHDLQQNDIQVLDNGQPPAKVMYFTPQSKLPLRIALLVDTSGSVEGRLSFEKQAAGRFIEKVLTNSSDLGFVEGFSNTPEVMQDFTAQGKELVDGIEKMHAGGGTALFDAVSTACLKLSAYPDHERVARVLVLLTDGEENSSHTTLKQAIQDAEANGVTVYTVSTRTGSGDKTDADKVLETLAERTGGEAYFPGDLVVLNRAFEKLSDTIRSRYLVSYKPADFSPDGKFRSIAIAASQNGSKLQVRARKGYHARLERPLPPQP